MGSINVKKIAIIGAGPGGLAVLNELLHTSKDGKSTINQPNSLNPLPEAPAFEEIVVFEQANHLGGVWNYSKETDPSFPTVTKYSDPKHVRPKSNAPSFEQLSKSTKSDPFVTDIVSETIKKDMLWGRSAVYDNMFTNVPNRLMKFSAGFDINATETNSQDDDVFHPYQFHQEVQAYLQKFSQANNLKNYIRFNSCVEKVFKNTEDGKWYVVVMQVDHVSGKEKWYMESFDAVVVAAGRFNVPFIPNIENLEEFNKKNPGVVTHTKGFRNTEDLANKKVLLVGGGISAVDLLQYLIPKCAETWMSTNRSNVKEASDGTKAGRKLWSDEVLEDTNLKYITVPRIKKFEGSKVIFEDGSSGEGFDRIIFATGYHFYYPFLDISENKGKDYISISSGRLGNDNFAKTKVDNLYYYSFTIVDPTLCHVGLIDSPMLFFISEAIGAAISGVWSGANQLPSVEKQRMWLENWVGDKTSAFQLVMEDAAIPFIHELLELGPDGRYDSTQLFRKNEVRRAKQVLKTIFYKFADKVIGENDEKCLYHPK